MNATELNPPAFPRDERYLGHNGMTLRDWFAGQALAGLSSMDSGGVQSILCIARESGRTGTEIIASIAYERADAMLAARTQEPTTC